MPLLKTKILDKVPVPEYLRDDEEVFHCVMTNEIFREYEDFADRTILCNSMVWTCAMTGTRSLTYEEALQSEAKAKNLLEQFPVDFRVRVLYVAHLMKHSCFSDLVDNVYAYIKSNFFIGEEVLLWHNGKKNPGYTVKEVNLATADEIEQFRKTRVDGPDSLFNKYTLVKVDRSNNTEEIVAEGFLISRKKFIGKDKSKLFLKQYVQQHGNGNVVIKASALESFGIQSKSFEQACGGPKPDFSKQVNVMVKPKKIKQTTLSTFLKKNNLTETLEGKVEKKDPINTAEMNEKLREFRKLREDLILEDQKKLPVGKPFVSENFPEKYMGDAVEIADFLYTFSDFLKFDKKLSPPTETNIIIEALLDKKVSGPMNNLLFTLLDNVFRYQDEDSRQYSITFDKADWNGSTISPKLTISESVDLATELQQWFENHLGSQLSDLPLDTLTITEQLRLHLLSSGARWVENSKSRHRGAQRGGWATEDDPAVQFRISNPHIIRLLGSQNVVYLSISDKLKVINCLINQLLTYKEFREHALDLTERHSEMRNHMRTHQRILKENSKTPTDAIKEMEATRTILAENVSNLGYDRAFRQYFILESMPGLLICHDDPNTGNCLDEITVNVPELVNIDTRNLQKYLLKTGDEMNSSDKENDPKDTVKVESVSIKVENGHTDECRASEMFMCTTDKKTCLVHSANLKYNKWTYIEDQEALDELINSLNKRGYREANLYNHLKYCYNYIVSTMSIHNPRGNSIKDPNLGYSENLECNKVEALLFAENLVRMERDLKQKGLGNIHNDRNEACKWRSQLKNLDFSEMSDTILKPHVEKESETNEIQEPSEYTDPGSYSTKCVTDIESEDSDDCDDIVPEQTSDDRQTIKWLATILAQIAFSINPEYIFAPLGTSQRSNKFARKNVISNWERSLLNATSYSQLFLHFNILDSSIRWKKMVSECVVCATNKNPSAIALCAKCDKAHHIYCLRPKLKLVPKKKKWVCPDCLLGKTMDESLSDEESKEEHKDYCVVCKGPETEEMAYCSDCPDSYHLDCASLRRTPRNMWLCNKCKDKHEKQQNNDLNKSFDSYTQRRSNRVRDEQDNPLHNVALHELLVNVMKHADSWPFVTPVSKKEVPDYHTVITKPMDFGTIKYKLNMGEYKYDKEFMSDAWLIFDNSNTYNSSDDEVYKCGLTLSAYFVEYANKLNIAVPAEFLNDEAPLKKRRRTR